MTNIEKLASSPEYCAKLLSGKLFYPWCIDLDECEDRPDCERCVRKWLDAEYKGETP